MTYAVLILSGFLTGTVVTETVFSWPGLGRLAVVAIQSNDFPMMAGAVMLGTGLIVLANFAIDIASVIVDPRIKFE